VSVNSLYEAARLGDAKSEGQLFGLLYERFSGFVNRRIWDKTEAEDIVQNALAVIAREYKSVKISISFSAWAYKVLDNKILSYFGSRQRHRDRGFQTLTETHTSAEIDPDMRLQLLACLKKLNAVNTRHARVLNLHYHGFSTEEICEKIAVTRNGLYIALHRARTMLAMCLKTGEVAI
jgi:RNA polymerase sigma factor (sigma-70 family)